MNLRKQILTIGLLFVLTLTSFSQQFTIKGTIAHPQPTKAVMLQALDAATMKYKLVQNISVTKEGYFTVILPFKERNMYRLKVYEASQKIAIEKPETIQVTVTGKKSKKIKVQSTGNKQMAAFHAHMNQLQGKHFAGLKERAMKAVKEKNTEEMAKLEVIKNEKLKGFEKDLKQFIDDQGVSVGAYYSIQFMDLNMHLDFFKKIAKKFKKKAPGQNLTQALLKDIKSAEKTAIGAFAPAFTLIDIDGKKQNLTDYKGKYVVIEFWASWCLGCRIEYPKLKKIYSKYKSKGLEILGVSDDQQEKKWRAAVKRDELPWKNMWINQSKIRKDYNISNLPFNLLLDKEGRIVAKKLTPEQLEAKIKELMASGK